MTESATKKQVNIEIEAATKNDLDITQNGWQTVWNTEFILDPQNEKYVAKTEDGEIISTGSCGVLTDLAENEFLIPAKALRDEGTSYHYLPASRYIELDQTIRDAIEQTLLAQKIPFRECVTWTTDGFFRETQDMVKYRRAEGCTTVEMECAALAACARKRGASFGQILYTADSLANVLEHNERDWGKNSLRKALALCIAVLQAV